jgi:hypothetical protein
VVPLIKPVEELKVKPFGKKVGDSSYAVTVPPVLVIVYSDAVSFWKAEKLSPERVIIGGSPTSKVKVAEDVPAMLIAVIVYIFASCIAVGEPDNNPVVVLKIKPAGAEGEIV